MIEYKGKTSLKQYMPMKPIKRGIKMWCRADSTNDYLSEFDIYTGKSPQGVQHALGYSVVTKLCHHVQGHWYAFSTTIVLPCTSLLKTCISPNYSVVAGYNQAEKSSLYASMTKQ